MKKPLCEGLKQNFCPNRADVQAVYLVHNKVEYSVYVKGLGLPRSKPFKVSWTWLCRECSDDRAFNDWELITQYGKDGRIQSHVGVVMPIEGQIPQGRIKYFERAFTNENI